MSVSYTSYSCWLCPTFGVQFKISTKNALEFLASGKGFIMDRLTGSTSKRKSWEESSNRISVVRKTGVRFLFYKIYKKKQAWHTTLHGVTNVKRSSQYVDYPLLALISVEKLNKDFFRLKRLYVNTASSFFLYDHRILDGCFFGCASARNLWRK